MLGDGHALVTCWGAKAPTPDFTKVAVELSFSQVLPAAQLQATANDAAGALRFGTGSLRHIRVQRHNFAGRTIRPCRCRLGEVKRSQQAYRHGLLLVVTDGLQQFSKRMGAAASTSDLQDAKSLKVLGFELGSVGGRDHAAKRLIAIRCAFSAQRPM